MAKRPTLADVHPDIAQDWHPSQNGDKSPRDVSPAWRKPVWWLCEHGHAYQATVHAKVRGASCPLCIADHTSHTEQWLLTAVRKHYPSTQHRQQVKVGGGKQVEVDLWIPDFPLAIEYDGPHHQSRLKADNKKNFLLQRAGIPLVRIRQAGLPPLADNGTVIIEHHSVIEGHLATCVNELLNWIERTLMAPGN